MYHYISLYIICKPYYVCIMYVCVSFTYQTPRAGTACAKFFCHIDISASCCALLPLALLPNMEAIDDKHVVI